MAKRSYQTIVNVRVAAPSATLWTVLAEHEQMPRWFPARKVVLEREGHPSRNGVGAVRAIYALGPPAREQITVFEPEQLLEYRLLSGLPFGNYVGQASITPHRSGCTLTWTISFTELIPGSRLIVSALAKRLATGAARQAEKIASLADGITRMRAEVSRETKERKENLNGRARS